MAESVDLSLPVLLCAFVLFAASISLNFRLFLDKNNLTSRLNAAVRSGTSAPVAGQDNNKLTTLPPGWWSDENIFQLERRALFSKTWICVSHRGRFTQPGDYVSYELAGFRYFLILGKDDVVRAFHNVCRHRAFPVTQKMSGSATVLGCKYHGWSYDTKGQLTKAPQFDNVASFDKTKNSLFEIDSKMDKYGFIHINLDGSPDAGNSEVPEGKKIGRPARVHLQSRFLRSWEFKGKFNWKVTVDDPVQDGGESSGAFKQSQSGGIFRALSGHNLTPMGQISFYPVTRVYTKTGVPLWYQITVSPDSAKQTTIRCDVYSSKKLKPSQSEDAIRGLESEIKSMIAFHEEAYSELTGLKSNLGISSVDQAKIANAVKAHQESEAAQGREINPAAVQQNRSAAYAQAESLCLKVECGDDKLDW